MPVVKYREVSVTFSRGSKGLKVNGNEKSDISALIADSLGKPSERGTCRNVDEVVAGIGMKKEKKGGRSGRVFSFSDRKPQANPSTVK